MRYETIANPGGHSGKIAYLSKWPQAGGEAVGWLQLKKIGAHEGKQVLEGIPSITLINSSVTSFRL
jgi:hypothetical protein